MTSNLKGKAWDQHPESPAAPPPDSNLGIWAFYDYSYAHEVPCETLRRFLFYLVSPGTKLVEVSSIDSVSGAARISVYGPLCDDANEYMKTDEMHKAARLVARWRLDKHEIHDCEQGLDAGEKQLLVKAIGEKSGVGMKPFCNALNLRQVEEKK